MVEFSVQRKSVARVPVRVCNFDGKDLIRLSATCAGIGRQCMTIRAQHVLDANPTRFQILRRFINAELGVDSINALAHIQRTTDGGCPLVLVCTPA